MTAEQLCAVCGTRPVRMVLNEVPLCDRCSDRQLSAVTGWPELPDPPPPQKVTGPDGRTHLMEFRRWRAPALHRTRRSRLASALHRATTLLIVV